MFLIWVTGVFFMVGFTLGNINAIAMEPLGHVAGMAASAISALATVVGVVLAVPLGLAFDGTVGPLALGVATLAAVALAIQMQVRLAPDQARGADGALSAPARCPSVRRGRGHAYGRHGLRLGLALQIHRNVDHHIARRSKVRVTVHHIAMRQGCGSGPETSHGHHRAPAHGCCWPEWRSLRAPRPSACCLAASALWVCSSTRSATSDVALTSRSSAPAWFSITMKAAPDLAMAPDTRT
jgi:hypothetical protein